MEKRNLKLEIGEEKLEIGNWRGEIRNLKLGRDDKEKLEIGNWGRHSVKA